MQYIPRNRVSFIDQLNPFVNRIFQHAVMQGDMAIITLMLKHGIVVKRNQRNPHGLTALQQSVLDGNGRLVVMLMESGADLEAKTSNGWTCLHIASATGDIYIAKLLLANCADIVALTSNEELPIDLAVNTDMKILLANEMSRCGYIELSQWYMSKIAQQESGLFYVMSADSLIDIACDRSDPFSSSGYDFYHQNHMQTYSSMINLSRHSASDANLGKARKSSAWSLAQPNSYVNRTHLQHNSDDTHSHTLPAKSRRDRSHSKTDKTLDIGRDAMKKSSSSASVIDRADCLQVPYDETPGTRMVNSASDNVLAVDRSIVMSVSSPYLSTACPDNGNHVNVPRRNSLRRKKSSPQISDRNPEQVEVDHRLELTIDYFKESLDFDDDDDDDTDYLQFDGGERTQRQSMSSSEASLPDEVTQISQEDLVGESGKMQQIYGDNDAVADNRVLLQEFADPYSGSSHFEIDTDNMDQYVVNSDGSVDQILPAVENVSKTSHESGISIDDPNHGNMYFNPMYKSTDIQGCDAGLVHRASIEHDGSYRCNSESDQDIHLDWQSSESGSTGSNCADTCGKSEFPSRMDCKPYEIYSEETEVICNETELIERKRKKKGLLSELVSRIKKGSTKMQRTSSDTNLHQNEDSSIVRRDTRKVKTLRRRRHVRRSNSFSSYFSQNADRNFKAGVKLENKDTTNDSINQNIDNGECTTEQRSILAPPYSPHRRQKRPLTPQGPRKAPPANQKYSSLPRKGSKGSYSLKSIKKYGNALCAEDDWMEINSYNTWEPSATGQKEKAVSIGNESKFSKIPTRSMNTYVTKDLATYQ